MASNETGADFESFVFDRDSETHYARYDRQTTSASMAVVTVMAEVLCLDPINMSPLCYAVDTEALNGLFGREAEAGEDVRISFAFADHHVTVTGDSVSVTSGSNEGGDAE